jgi:mono/diheme cytochrome c family protein
MRHQLATRFVVVLTVVLALAVVLWAALARTATAPAAAPSAADRTSSVLELDGDVDRGRDIFLDTPGRACASCHSFERLDVDADGGPPIEALEVSPRDTVASLLEGTVPTHDDERYEHLLSNQQIADLVALLEDAGNG